MIFLGENISVEFMSADKRFGHVCCSTRSRSTSHAFIDLPLLHVSNSVEYCALDIERANEPVSLLCGTSSHPACWQTGQRSLCSIRASTTTSVSLRPVQRRSWFVAFPATWNINSCEVSTHCKRTMQLSLLQHGTRFNTEIVERSIYLVQSDFIFLSMMRRLLSDQSGECLPQRITVWKGFRQTPEFYKKHEMFFLFHFCWEIIVRVWGMWSKMSFA